MSSKTERFLKRLAAGRNPRARNRSDEYEPHEEIDFDELAEQDSEPWYYQRQPDVYVHLPSRKGKRRGKVKEVWFD